MIEEKQAIEILISKGIEVQVTAPLCLRAFGKKVIRLKVRAPYLGTQYRISELWLSAGIGTDELQHIDAANAHTLHIKHGRLLAKIAAIALLRGYWAGKLFAGLLSRWLYWRLTGLQLLTLANVLVLIGNKQAFTNTIRLIGDMKMTSPNLSQINQGS